MAYYTTSKLCCGSLRCTELNPNLKPKNKSFNWPLCKHLYYVNNWYINKKDQWLGSRGLNQLK